MGPNFPLPLTQKHARNWTQDLPRHSKQTSLSQSLNLIPEILFACLLAWATSGNRSPGFREIFLGSNFWILFYHHGKASQPPVTSQPTWTLSSSHFPCGLRLVRNHPGKSVTEKRKESGRAQPQANHLSPNECCIDKGTGAACLDISMSFERLSP